MQRRGDPVVTRVNQGEASSERREAISSRRQGGGIPVETDHAQSREPGEETFGVAAGTERGVDEDRTGSVGASTRQGGFEKFDAAIEQDGTCPCLGKCQPRHGLPVEGLVRSHRGPCPKARTWRWGSTSGSVRAETTMQRAVRGCVAGINCCR